MSIDEELLRQLSIKFPATENQIQLTYDELVELGFSHVLALIIACALINNGVDIVYETAQATEDSLYYGWLSLLSSPGELSEIHQMILDYVFPSLTTNDK
jgi:hypothetical protein